MQFRKNIFAIVVIILASGVTSAYAQKRKLTLEEAIDSKSEMVVTSLPGINWDGDDHYIEGLIRFGDRVRVNVKTGEKKEYKFPSRKQQNAIPKGTQENWLLSPDSTWAAYTKDNNLYGVEIATGRVVQYTNDGSEAILNGKAAWVYYEEILNHSTRTFWWSPDSRHLVFYRSDESKVPNFPIYNAEGHHGSVKWTRYPKAGDPNPQVSIGIIDVRAGSTIWADFDYKQDQYFGIPHWSNEGSIWIQWMPREQNRLKIYSVDMIKGGKKEVYNEDQSTWVDWKDNIYFLKSQPLYVVQNDTDGWDRLYLYHNDGRLKNCITMGKDFWNTKVVYIDELKQTIFFTSYGEISIRCDLYSVKFDGSALRRLTFGHYHHQVDMSPTAKYFITRYSNIETPNKIAVVDARTGKIIREIADSKSKNYDSLELDRTEIVWYTTTDGLRLPAVIRYPAGMDTTVKHPVTIFTYGGPNAGRVQDRFWGVSSWKSIEGVIHVVLDHRGSGYLGKKGLNYLHRNLGHYEISDFTDFVKQQLYSKSYVDKDKITLEGHSYGGYLTALALTKGGEYFRIGIADAGVMDWRLYDSHYTERYMDTPQSNPEGYKTSSVLTYVDNYRSGNNMLYIRHGLADDNVHAQNSLQLINLMELKKKPFEMMLYPGCTHSYLGAKFTTTQNDALRFWYRYILNKDVPKELIR